MPINKKYTNIIVVLEYSNYQLTHLLHLNAIALSCGIFLLKSFSLLHSWTEYAQTGEAHAAHLSPVACFAKRFEGRKQRQLRLFLRASMHPLFGEETTNQSTDWPLKGCASFRLIVRLLAVWSHGPHHYHVMSHEGALVGGFGIIHNCCVLQSLRKLGFTILFATNYWHY